MLNLLRTIGRHKMLKHAADTFQQHARIAASGSRGVVVSGNFPNDAFCHCPATKESWQSPIYAPTVESLLLRLVDIQNLLADVRQDIERLIEMEAK